jgi:hypothetical protein
MTELLARSTRALLALTIALAPAVGLLALVHDVLPAHPRPLVSWAIGAIALTASLVLIGRPLAQCVAIELGLRRTVAIGLGVMSAVAYHGLAPARLLVSGSGVVEQLAWILGEEDNAQIVGVAREVIIQGPAGAELSLQYGTGFMVLPTVLQRLLPALAADDDARLAAVSAFTLSVVLAILLLGLAMFLLGVLVPRSTERPSVGTLILASIVTGGATAAALAVAVVLPMRTGFLTLVWSIAWVGLVAAMTAAAAHRLTPITRAFLAVQVLVLTLLVIRSWPFLIAAVLPPVALLLRPLPWRTIRSMLRRWWFVAVLAVAGIIGVTLPYLLDSAVGEVLSYGREALTVGGSGIFADRAVVVGITLGVLAAIPLLLRHRGSDPNGSRAISIDRIGVVVGIPLAVWLSWVALKVAAALLTGGELNYAGSKLLYAAVAVGAAVTLPSLAGMTSATRSPLLRLAAPAALGALIATSSTVQTSAEWWDRTAPQSPPHAVAAIDAVRASSVDLPIRCTPQPGAAATDGARWAAYYCVRWMEDAFNTERFHGHRFTFLNADGPTFEEAVARARAEDPSRYTFAYPMTVGPGWFGWDGMS